MASRPATPSLPLAVLAEGRAAAVTPSPVVTGTIKEYKTPVDSEQKRRASRFSALRKVVQWKEWWPGFNLHVCVGRLPQDQLVGDEVL